MESVYSSVGWDGLFSIFVTLGFVAVSWVLLQEVKWDQFIRHPRSPRARLLQLFLAIILGHLLAAFVLDYWNWTTALKWLFLSE
ncbi:DUF1146 family protein [Cohnella nanjingensis]|uniref:DUF1146 domain-containing protein n=1 Tax=Cohnella nanjingensis TaxID=1387779 RepID=A0A7X0RNA0_9BACL|nr:DUF1146 family protein [Cohnella nanjingensis]MBB6670595.1 DUF1146 domain-containing protein [Cohnella nanjingensis]